MYPNPFENELIIDILLYSNSEIEIRLTDFQGKELNVIQTKESKGAFKYNINSEYLIKGTYFIRVTTNGNTTLKKVIKI